MFHQILLNLGCGRFFGGGTFLVGQRAFILSLSVESLDHQINSKLDKAVFFLRLDLDLFEILLSHSLTATENYAWLNMLYE